MKHIATLVLILTMSSQTFIGSAQSLATFNQQADQFFKTNVVKGKVNYKKLKDNFSEVDKLYASLNTIDLAKVSDDEIKSFYINAYNIIVIHQIAKYYPLKSALDRNGFFDKVKHNVAGENLTLDQIEKGKVILKFRDPRVHFAFSCAATGCPELANFGFNPEMIEQQLVSRTTNAVNNPNFIKVNNQSKEVSVSMIFKWYEKDFLENDPSVLAYINRFRTQKIPDNYTLKFYDYDWSLNAL